MKLLLGLQPLILLITLGQSFIFVGPSCGPMFIIMQVSLSHWPSGSGNATAWMHILSDENAQSAGQVLTGWPYNCTRLPTNKWLKVSEGVIYRPRNKVLCTLNTNEHLDNSGEHQIYISCKPDKNEAKKELINLTGFLEKTSSRAPTPVIQTETATQSTSVFVEDHATNSDSQRIEGNLKQEINQTDYTPIVESDSDISYIQIPNLLDIFNDTFTLGNNNREHTPNSLNYKEDSNTLTPSIKISDQGSPNVVTSSIPIFSATDSIEQITNSLSFDVPSPSISSTNTHLVSNRISQPIFAENTLNSDIENSTPSVSTYIKMHNEATYSPSDPTSISLFNSETTTNSVKINTYLPNDITTQSSLSVDISVSNNISSILISNTIMSSDVISSPSNLTNLITSNNNTFLSTISTHTKIINKETILLNATITRTSIYSSKGFILILHIVYYASGALLSLCILIGIVIVFLLIDRLIRRDRISNIVYLESPLTLRNSLEMNNSITRNKVTLSRTKSVVGTPKCLRSKNNEIIE